MWIWRGDWLEEKWLGAIVLLCTIVIVAAVWMSGKDKQKQSVDFAKEVEQNLQQPEAVESVQEDGPLEEEVAEVEPVVEESEPIKEIPAEANELLKETDTGRKRVFCTGRANS
ncbi:hypothetical protein NLX67_03165 [Domibacillus sp. A3M-37]|uniref:hypothetical protein n=1 Tax=Domibacillus sp. A3M-37 TaxID=2962037 RepID=UPI0020B843FF|nr:hypothetical protein [Domibacillus sp. A3M-37]MCP3761390.1 hypothetical protein [Domibacillus sp. A3M-37]